MTGSLSLDNISKRFHMLEVRWGKCTRSGRLRIDKLIDEHGRDMSLPDLRAISCRRLRAEIRSGARGSMPGVLSAAQGTEAPEREGSRRPITALIVYSAT